MAVCWWLTGGLVLFAWTLKITLAEEGNFYDFNCVPSDRADDGYQYISPNLTFPCDGVVSKWKIGTENRKNELVYLQIWQPVETGYSRVAETIYTHSSGTIAEVTTDMTVSAGDVIGFFVPAFFSVGLRVAWAAVPEHTLLQGMRSSAGVSPVATFSDILTTLSSSPLVSVIFEPSASSCASTGTTATPVSSGKVCLGTFDDFRVVCGESAEIVRHKGQYIMPELSFSCDGTVAQWKVGLEDGGNGQSMNLQIWRSVGAGQYTSVTEVVYTKTVKDERVATIPVSMSVMAGDMVGFYVSAKRLQLHALPDVGLTVCTTRGISASTLSQLSCTLGPSPYISVVFVPDVTSSSVPSMTSAAPLSPRISVAATSVAEVTHVSFSSVASSRLPAAGESSTTESSTMDLSSQFPPANDRGDPSTQVSGAIVGVVVVIVLVVGSVVVASSLIAWKVRNGKASTGVSPPETSIVMTMQDNPSYSAVQEGLVMKPNPAYEEISGIPPEASTDVTMQANPSYIALEGVALEPNPCYSTVQANHVYEPTSDHAPIE